MEERRYVSLSHALTVQTIPTNRSIRVIIFFIRYIFIQLVVVILLFGNLAHILNMYKDIWVQR